MQFYDSCKTEYKLHVAARTTGTWEFSLPIIVRPRKMPGEGVTSIGGRTRCAIRKKNVDNAWVSKSGVGADREKGVKVAKKNIYENKGIRIAMIRVQAMGLYMERVGKLRQHVHLYF